MEDGQEEEGNDNLRNVRDMRRRARGETNERKEEPARGFWREVRVGDWTCQTVACRGWSNFKWRTVCMRCGKSPGGKELLQREGSSEPNVIPYSFDNFTNK